MCFFEFEKFFFFGSEKFYQWFKRFFFLNVCVEFLQEFFDIVFIDVIVIKEYFIDLKYFKVWVEVLYVSKKILFYEFFVEGSLFFDLSNFILIVDEIFRVEE